MDFMSQVPSRLQSKGGTICMTQLGLIFYMQPDPGQLLVIFCPSKQHEAEASRKIYEENPRTTTAQVVPACIVCPKATFNICEEKYPLGSKLYTVP